MAKNKKSRTCLIVGLALVVGCLCLTVALAGVGYFLYSSGKLSLDDILNLAGFGPGEIQVINLSDGEIEAALTRINEQDGETISEGDFRLAPYDIQSFRSLNSNRYLLEINPVSGVPEAASCSIGIRGGDLYRIVVVPEGTVITLDGEEVERADQVNILTSPHCQP